MSDDTNDSACGAPAEAPLKALLQAHVVRELLRGMQQATGLAIKIVPTDACQRCGALEFPENPFCAFAKRQGTGSSGCCKTHADLLSRVQRDVRRHRLTCFAGMLHAALPIIVRRQHVATLTAGQVFLRQPGRRAFGRVRKALIRLGRQKQLARLERLWRRTPCVSPRAFMGCVALLTGFARLLADCAGHWVIENRNTAPLAVERAKQYVRTHLAEQIMLRAVAKHIDLNPHYFCKLFRRTTGLTLTHYIRMVRIERAKELLCEHRDPPMAIKVIASNAGFRLVSHFDHVFKRLEGVSPTRFRANPRQQK